MQVGRQEMYRTCAVCFRTLLQGERSARYSSGGDQWVDVCPLCIDQANERGWIKEGTPTQPIVAETQRKKRRRFAGLAALIEPRREEEPERVVSEPVLRRLSPEEQLLVEASEVFNKSQYARTIAGVAKSLGPARVSMMPLSGTNTEIVITIVWDISWYQYRVFFESAQPVRLEERGQDISELAERYQSWNATFDPVGRLRPEIPRF
jgi:hypothetical protein